MTSFQKAWSDSDLPKKWLHSVWCIYWGKTFILIGKKILMLGKTEGKSLSIIHPYVHFLLNLVTSKPELFLHTSLYFLAWLYFSVHSQQPSSIFSLPYPSSYSFLSSLLGFCWIPAAAAARSLQSCPTLCDPIDGSPPGSPVPGILQARVLEWGAMAFSKVPLSFILIINAGLFKPHLY